LDETVVLADNTRRALTGPTRTELGCR
jgi:hypothetical protein